VTPEVPTRNFRQIGRIKIRRGKGLFKHRKKIDSNIHLSSQIGIQYSGELFAERTKIKSGDNVSIR